MCLFVICETYNVNIYFSLLHYEFEAVGTMKKGINFMSQQYWVEVDIEAGADLRLRLIWTWGWNEVESKLSWTWVGVEISWHWIKEENRLS